MAHLVEAKKSCAVNPLKMSQPLGAAYAFMGLQSCMPVMHGSQGCTSFGVVLLVRHFKEAIPLQTTAMNEATTIMGGFDNLEKAILNIHQRAQPQIIAICSTGLTETKGDDVPGMLRLVRQKHPELDGVAIVYVSTPDFALAFQDGWAKAVTALVESLVDEVAAAVPTAASTVTGTGTDTDTATATTPAEAAALLVNVLPGCHLTPGDIDELRELVEAFGLQPVFVPDVSGSLDGHIPDEWLGTTLGGTPLQAVRNMGRARHTLAIGEQMRPAARALHTRCGVPFTVFDRLTGLTATDAFVQALSTLSGRAVPERLRRQRSQLVDAMLDAHFHFGGVKVAVAAEPDLLFAAGSMLTEMGAELAVSVTTTHSPLLERLPGNEVLIGDLEDFERLAAAAGCDLLMTHSHGRQAAERLHKPLFRLGIPSFDRIGNAHRCMVGYRGTRQFVYEVGNLLIEQLPHHGPDAWPLPASSLPASSLAAVAVPPAVAHLPAHIPRLSAPGSKLPAAST
jgi:nitrogenase molybdenum-iron protein NifN